MKRRDRKKQVVSLIKKNIASGKYKNLKLNFLAENDVAIGKEENQKLELSADADADVKALTSSVDDIEVPMLNGKGSILLAPGNHLLSWEAIGNEGGTFSIIGKLNNNEVVKVGDRKIGVTGSTAGVKPFGT